MMACALRRVGDMGNSLLACLTFEAHNEMTLLGRKSEFKGTFRLEHSLTNGECKRRAGHGSGYDYSTCYPMLVTP